MRPPSSDLDAVAELIDRHEKVTLYCGAGVRDAHAEVLALAGRIKAPVGYTLRGKEWIEHDNPYAVGLTGLIGFGGCTKALHDADLLLLVGTDFPYRQFIPEGKTIVQIDSRPEHLGRRTRLDYGMAGDAALTLRGLMRASRRRRTTTRTCARPGSFTRRPGASWTSMSATAAVSHRCTPSSSRRRSTGSPPRTPSSSPTPACPRCGRAAICT